MTVEEKQQHLNNISRIITEIQSDVQGMSYEEFSKEEQVKEDVYTQLQMAGQAAHELSSNSEEHPDLNYVTDLLANFRNARYNQIVEHGDRQVWNVIQEDLEEIRKQIIETSAELENDQMDDDITGETRTKI